MASTRPPKRARVALTEQRAWQIAVAVSAPLEGRVRLVSSQRELEHARTYEWVELAVPLPEQMPAPALRSTLNWVVEARNACLVWHMLACCRGFQGHENDAFWKRLIEFVGNKERRDGAVDYESMDVEEIDEEEDERQWWGATPPVNDAHQFFPVWWDEKKTSFPRFRLHVPYSQYFDFWGYVIADDDLDIETADDWITNVVKTFIGINNAFENAAIKNYASELFKSIAVDCFCKTPVDIGVHLGPTYRLDDLADTLSELIADIETDALARKEEKHPWRLIGKSRFPLAKFTELSLCDREAIAGEDSLNELTEIIRTCNVFIPEVCISPNPDHMGSEALTDFMDAVNRFSRKEGGGRVDKLTLLLNNAEDWQVELLFSSIPITGVRTLRVCGNIARFGEHGGPTMTRHAWTWLAYAVYHPWLFHSPLKLDLEFLDISEAGAKVMEGALTAQRHLFRLQNGEEDETLPAEDDFEYPLGRYAIVGVRKGARCYEDASLTGDKVCKFSEDINLTAVIKFDIFDIKNLPDVVCVVVPGRGVGWIAKAYVTDVSRPFADFSQIMGLRLGRPRADPHIKISALHPLVSHLSGLDISAWKKLTSAELFDVLCECYLVKSLSVSHDGELFHEWTADTPEDDEDDRLWEMKITNLRLVMFEEHATLHSPSPAAWQGVLQNLEELTIETAGSRTRLLPVVRQVFQEAYPVQRFVWRRGWGSSNESFSTKRNKCRTQLGISEGRFDTAQRALDPAARRAFASVIKRKAVENDARDARGLRSRKGSAMGRLGPDVARLICDFATTHSKRVVWFEER